VIHPEEGGDRERPWDGLVETIHRDGGDGELPPSTGRFAESGLLEGRWIRTHDRPDLSR
jgi:hypothetical protein